MNTFDEIDIGAERQLADLFTRQDVPITPTDTDLGTFVRKDILTAKGDLFAATSGSSIGRQAISSDGKVLTADSTTSTGMDWKTPAATSEPYVTIGNTAGLTAERALTGTANQITITDNGANNTVVLSTPQNLHTAATPTFANLTLGGGLRVVGFTSSAADPSTTELTTNKDVGIHKNTVSGNIFLAYNNAGVILKVQLV